MSTMLAARLDYTTRKLEMKSVPIPEPGPGQVRIRVGAAGICLSDVHIIDGSMAFKPRLETVTLGHEVAGTIEKMGENVPAPWKLGQRVTLQAGQGCGACWDCQRRISPCRYVLTRGVDYDGGWAEYALADHFTLVAIPDDLPLEQAAIIPDAVSTPWAAIVLTGQVRPAESAGVWGVGGLGSHAIQLLRLVGAAPILAMDPLKSARDRALQLGADFALDPTSQYFNRFVREATDHRGLDVAFDMVGLQRVCDQAQTTLGPNGRLVLVGIASGELGINSSVGFTYRQQQIRGHYGSLPQHVEQLVELVRRKRLDLSQSISEVLPLADAPLGVERLAKKIGNPVRLILRP